MDLICIMLIIDLHYKIINPRNLVIINLSPSKK